MKYYVVIDLEMCKVPKGAAKSYGKSNEVIQIGAVKLDEQYQILEDRFMTYVKPQYGSLDTFINHLTGITQKDLKNAPCFEEALRQFELWLPDGEVEMVSWSRTDLKQLQNERRKALFQNGLRRFLKHGMTVRKHFLIKWKRSGLIHWKKH